MGGVSLNIVIPMAGMGSRFGQAGYTKPKPFIDMWGEPMIARVLENLAYPGSRYILIARKEHVEAEREIVNRLAARFPIQIKLIDQPTEGSAATVLFAREDYANDTPMLVANCDQIVDGGIAEMVDGCLDRNLDGSIMVFRDEARDPKWSFVKLDEQGLVTEAREKAPISDLATVGIYMFSRGVDFREAAIEMIVRNDRVNREFYTCPAFNYLVGWGRRIGVHMIEPEAMHGIGTPDDLTRYMSKFERPAPCYA
jgi:UDP-N-acetylglucosamine diphosphorylase / glucose-1-phosphate thymidylyltransferase / UDP-N-acetylgalactosamine diphosphorylase / glucosamine-1-phosphate N-acetyltransferase / galactosamine-1-phosphate N-acetyltransferase